MKSGLESGHLEPGQSGAEGLHRLLEALPSAPKARGDAFERLCKWFLKNDPVYQSLLRHVWLWNEWPGKWGIDAGIDLVAEARNGELWAIQAKAYSPHVRVTKEDVNTFLSESSRPEFQFRLLIASTNLMGETAKRTLKNQQIRTGTLMLGGLESAEVVWPKSLTSLSPRRHRPKTLFDYQKRAVKDVVEGLREHARAQLVMACGTGKTLTALHIAEDLQSRRVLVLVPSLSLVAQTIQVWLENTRQAVEFIAVCSDPSVLGEDELVSSVTDLSYPVTTDPDDIASFLRGRGGDRRIVFATYQSSPRIAEAMSRQRIPYFDLVIADEAHRLAGETSGDFGTVLRDASIRARKRLFMTATPRYFTGRVISEARERELEVASMDDESTFGPVLHALTFGDAIRQGLLTDYRVVVVGIDDAEFLQWADEGRFVTSEGLEKIDARTLATHIGLAKATRRFDLRRTISFHQRVEHARRFAALYPVVVKWLPPGQRPGGTIQSQYISGEMSAGQRSSLLASLRAPAAKRALLANARCLTEGIDVPSLDGVAFVGPRRSRTDIVQAVGRAIRLDPGKALGTIVVPVFLGSTEDAAQALDTSAFKPVWDVLKALRSHDADLAEELDQLRQGLGELPNRELRLPGKIVLDLPSRVGLEVTRAVQVRIVDETTSEWYQMLGVLRAYVAREGHARVPRGWIEQQLKLGSWVTGQRALRKSLSEERRGLLESLPGWTWSVHADTWERSYLSLLQFVSREGHARPSPRHLEGSLRLGLWVSKQRAKRSLLSEEQVKQLEALPGWSWDPRDEAWELGFARLVSYADREGHTRVPSRQEEDDFPLGAWVQSQRSSRRRLLLSADRKSRLESLPGWSWDSKGDESWDRAFGSLEAFVARNGHARVTTTDLDGDFKLGKWVVKQRSMRKSLSLERVRRLESLPGWTWNLKDDSWARMMRALNQFAAREGHVRVPRAHVEQGLKLGPWVTGQRAKRATLSRDRRAELEALPGWTWDVFDTKWEEGFTLLQQFVAREGHARVPNAHAEGRLKLGVWVTSQRRKRARLSQERRARLEALPGWTWDVSDDSWQNAFRSLLAFVDREGHARVPVRHIESGLKLGIWVRNQRKRKEALSKDQRRHFEVLPGWTWALQEDAWSEAFSSLETFVAREGHARVPSKHVEAGFGLGPWVQNQRRAQASMPADHRERLEALPGWSWNMKVDEWEQALASLTRFVESHGHARVPREFIDGDFKLGRWVQEQRSRRGSMTSKRKASLEAFPGWSWELKRDRWERAFEALEGFVAREGHARVPRGHVEDGIKLGTWLENQRRHPEWLDEERRTRIETLCGWSARKQS